ncbi:MAG: CoA pyrophosphatase [Gemmobacter sp.]|uniref:CoA pyrophosphatase n=1 Tax=Gemmobacter sp. TaxID=1898957 RepID=UPI001A485C63|nr:CoA pyrophosphatase [Gemmobacter sp.]MBL8563492.1 CoA pyrophosphatase [Gemmobacter sp.]
MTRPEALLRALSGHGPDSSDYDLNPEFSLPSGQLLRPAAVLIAICERPEGPSVLLTKRASGLKHHPGQIAFPGGKIDETDPTPEAAALREAQEEVGLSPALVQVLGRLPSHETVTGYTVSPILAHVPARFTPRAEAGEVEEVFHVPLAHVADLGKFRVEQRMWRGQWRRYYAVPYGPYYIWGATARMLRALAERLA